MLTSSRSLQVWLTILCVPAQNRASWSGSQKPCLHPQPNIPWWPCEGIQADGRSVTDSSGAIGRVSWDIFKKQPGEIIGTVVNVRVWPHCRSCAYHARVTLRVTPAKDRAGFPNPRSALLSSLDRGYLCFSPVGAVSEAQWSKSVFDLIVVHAHVMLVWPFGSLRQRIELDSLVPGLRSFRRLTGATHASAPLGL